MSHAQILACILGMCLVSYIPRVLPPLILAHRQLPPALSRWLKYVPTSVFGALVFSEIFIAPDNSFNFSWHNISLLSSLVVAIVAARTRSLAKSIIVGLATYWGLQHIM